MGRIVNKLSMPVRPAIIAAVLAASSLLITSCENILSALIGQDEEYQKQLLGYTVDPPVNRWIAGNETIKIQFDEGVDTGSLVLGGTLGITDSDIVPIDWSTSSHPYDTLSLDPVHVGGLWPEGSGTAVISVRSNTGKTVSAQVLSFDVQYSVCVDDTAVYAGIEEDGSVRFPFDTIQEGIDAADSVYSPGAGITIPVWIAAGSYSADCIHGIRSVASLANRVSLHGGYRSDFLGLHASGVSELSNSKNDAGGSDFYNPASVLYCGSSVSGNPVIENLRIEIGGSSGSTGVYAGIHIEGSNPILRNLEVDGVASNGPANTIAALIEGGAPTIENPVIDPGHASDDSIGLYVYNSALPDLSGTNTSSHRIAAGEGDNFAAAIVFDGASGTIDGITIAGPTNRPGGSINFSSDRGACIYMSGNSAPSITNNVFTMYGFWGNDFSAVNEHNTGSDPAEFTGNDFALSAVGVWYLDNDTGNEIDSSDCDTTSISFGGTSAPLVGATFGNFSSTLGIY